ncbi:hypothetical protein PRIPAC_88908, partial [Pristionchus pacificus]|uniref:Uncharacterized protein n=1 Tax=Pristionchus pacificus TaxID=54126 RepID=A0A2A6B906_PRIPA
GHVARRKAITLTTSFVFLYTDFSLEVRSFPGMPFLRLLPLLIVLPSLVISAPVKTSSYFNGNVFANVDFFKGVDVERAGKEVNGLSENAFHYVGLILVLIALATTLGTLFVGIVIQHSQRHQQVLHASGSREGPGQPSSSPDSSEERLKDAPTLNAVTYEHVLNRYGDWGNVRSQVLVNFFLLVLGSFHKNHVDHVKAISSLHTVTEGRHQQCCCDIPARLQRSHEEQGLVAATSAYGLLPYILAVTVAFSAPLWERPLGRRLMTLILCGLGVVISPLMLFCTDSVLSRIANRIIDMPSFLLLMIAISNIVELLPYNLRALAVLLHFLHGFCFIQLGALSTTLFFIGFALVLRVSKDPLCHLIMRNRADELLERIEADEERRWRTNKDGSFEHHMAIAQKVFTDLTCAEQEELKFSEFLQHIRKSWITIEILIAFLQSISSGVFEFEYANIRKQLFVDPYFVQASTLVGYMVVLAVLYSLRKTHRSRALIFVMCAMICVASLRHLLIRFDLKNKCSDHAFLQRKLNFAAFVLDSCFYGVCSSLQMMITLNFLEAVPSTMRLCSVAWVYLPLKITQEFCKIMLRGDRLQNPFVFLPIYAAHLAIVAVTIIRISNACPWLANQQRMIIEKVLTRVADRSMLDISKLVDRVSELAKRLTGDKEHRLVWNDDEDDIFVTLDTAKRMKAATDFAMWQRIIEKVPTRVADRSMLDISKLVDRVSELAKRLTGDKEHRLVWNDDEDDIFVTLDTAKRMKAAIDFAMWQSPEKPIVRILAKPEKRRPGRPRKSILIDSPSSNISTFGHPLKDARVGSNNDSAISPSVRPRRKSTLVDSDKSNDVLIAEENPSKKNTYIQEKRRPGRPRRSVLAESTAVSSPSIRERRKKISVDENENNVSMAEQSDEDTIKTEDCDEYDTTMTVQEKRKPGRPRKSTIFDSPVPNAPTEVKPPKTITDYFGSKSIEESGEAPQEKKRSGRSRKSIIVQSPGENDHTDKAISEADDVTMLQKKSKTVRPRMSLPANFSVRQESSNNTNVFQGNKRRGRPPRKSIVVNSPVSNSPIVPPVVYAADNNAATDAAPAIADQLAAQFEEWRGMRAAATATAAPAAASFNPDAAAATEDNSYAARAMKLLSDAVRRHENRRKELELIHGNISVKTEFITQ